MNELRRYKRFSVDIFSINGKMMFANEVDILDISIGGVSLKVDRRLNIGNEYTLKIGARDKTLTVKGSVVWSRISGTKKGVGKDVIPLYTAGMMFTNTANERLEELSAFIEELTYSTDEEVHRLSGLRFNMRFPMEVPRKAVLDLSENYAVKKISLGGMLIESGASLKIDDSIPMEIVLAGGRKIEFLGRIASCFDIPDKEPLRYDIGIEFIEMAEEGRAGLREFIRLLDKTQEGPAVPPPD